jgi:hypothetical protein
MVISAFLRPVQRWAAPIVPVIGRCEIVQANAIKRMDNAVSVITPFDEKETA